MYSTPGEPPAPALAGVSGVSACIAAALIGLGYGAVTSAAPYLTSLYFGLRTFGEICSYLFITVPLGGALGPALMGVGFDRTDSYQLALSLCFVAMLVLWFETSGANRE
jgi:fucose permease